MKCLKMIVRFLLITIAVSISSSTSVLAAEANIRVGLWTGQSSIMISANKVFSVKDPGTNDIFGKYNAGEKILVTQKNGRLYINNLPAKSMVLSVQAEGEDGRTEVNKKAYRGRILIKKAAEGMTVVNDLPLEQYLYSVVPEEMPSTWPAEALKAQAVAARSYALYSLNRHENEGFDVCALAHCQVYGGSNVENDIAKKAVDDTRGQVLVYAHKPIFAAFHASSGGNTENSEDIWGTYIPYLRSVKDYDRKSPAYHWTLQISPTDLSEKLRQYGYDIGNLQTVTLSGFGSGQSDRSENGAVKTVIFSGDKSIVKLTGSEVRRVMGLKSTKFAIDVIIPSPKKINVTIDQYSGYSKDIDVDLPDYKVPKMMTGAGNIHPITNRSGEVVEIEGYGSGHRVGMSQWGAKALSEQGYDYQAILYAYYSDVSIEDWY
ncbi:SpoIID/LytB domain-containing protein [Pectinatus haikarae]|uniref:Stage II sporulation protein D n=1 Tax=Pectinatus haikarae TaxID=349096 RepID=A0ABT9YAI1_9FIRM|nr:SpoIID/LytB domain-containing protein [Pectinatus haikarae]MDQ0204846.1 stage II sporulation protein D [Pectinatus haikarae]